MGLVRSLPVSGLAGIFEGGGLGVDGSDFKQEAAFQTGVSFGDFRSFIEVASENEPIAADDFLRFAKRAVHYRLPPDGFALVRESLSTLHFSLVHQSLKPDVEFVDGGRYFVSRAVAVPLSTRNYQVFGWRRLFTHDGLFPQVNLELRLAAMDQRCFIAAKDAKKFGCAAKFGARSKDQRAESRSESVFASLATFCADIFVLARGVATVDWDCRTVDQPRGG
jgi:hypothetical protein